MKKESINQFEDTAVSTLTANAVLEQEKKAQISFSIREEDRMYFVLVENAVPSQQFYRINRQMIVNRHAIKDVKAYPNQRIVVHLTVSTPENVLVPRLKVKAFLSWIEKG